MKQARILPLSSTDDPAFDAFWLAYPRHDHKFEARKAWEKLKLGPKAIGKLMAALTVRCDRKDWREHIQHGQLEFIPLASTWLNNRRFEDELLAPPVGQLTGRWYDECAQVHTTPCENRSHHELRKVKDRMLGDMP